MNLKRTIDYIIATIFRTPKNYLKPEKDKKEYTLPIPTKEERPFFKEFYVITIFLNAKLAHINNLEASKWVALYPQYYQIFLLVVLKEQLSKNL